jgi:hypothetical protein
METEDDKEALGLLLPLPLSDDDCDELVDADREEDVEIDVDRLLDPLLLCDDELEDDALLDSDSDVERDAEADEDCDAERDDDPDPDSERDGDSDSLPLTDAEADGDAVKPGRATDQTYAAPASEALLSVSSPFTPVAELDSSRAPTTIVSSDIATDVPK